MKFVRFTVGGEEFYGCLDQEQIQVVEGDIFSNCRITDRTFPLGSVKLLAPVKPTKVIGVGLNYKKVAESKGAELPTEPILFLKPPSSVIGPEDDIVIPDIVTQPAFEIELAVVIGKRAKNVSAADALKYVFGYTLGNDVTAKDHMIKGQPWARGKSFDTFTPLGPCLVTGLEPDAIELHLAINDAQKQNESTADMIIGTRELVAFISSIMTLEPGDVILTGTPLGGGGFVKGDTIELSSPQIGRMVNKVG